MQTDKSLTGGGGRGLWQRKVSGVKCMPVIPLRKTLHMDPYSKFRKSDERSDCSVLSNSRPHFTAKKNLAGKQTEIYLRTSRWEYHVTSWEPAQSPSPKSCLWWLEAEPFDQKCPLQNSTDANWGKFHYNQETWGSMTQLCISDKYRAPIRFRKHLKSPTAHCIISVYSGKWFVSLRHVAHEVALFTEG